MSSEIMENEVIVENVSRLLIPVIMLFGAYVIGHGHVSHGGGFQGGVIVSAAFVLYILVYGLEKGRGFANQTVRRLMESGGTLIFIIAGMAAIIWGGNFLEYPAIPLPYPDPTITLTFIALLEIAIGITVTAIIISIFITMGGETRK
ncbi:MnhB domain-containing protein [Methanonatronarchaeum sp. AMET-Sl]|uniref:MnhB domain-containing protein n=1 Tax=Methanonatronarchaeum sp. AMET-Sl TaxID=3037654 RepID=UPI00244E44B6|nr:MnhB domain-containing protein [Methanonatronarchaeum sp. AMET-Sl]WGI17499.1 MnhB domain-containing protein [Methanonatronarchaeum sp. AMET-Sl]